MGENAVRVMIVDDSLTVRTVLKRIVESAPNLVVSDTASSAEQAIAQLRRQTELDRADVILLDLEMPGMGGLDALPALLKVAGTAQVLVVSSLTKDGAAATMKALSMGAADTMLKPRPGGFDEEYRSQLLDKIFALGPDEKLGKPASAAVLKTGRPMARPKPTASFCPEVLAIGASTGGIHALNMMLRALPDHFDLPILITQHLPASFTSVFARQIQTISNRPTSIAEDGTKIRAGEITIATGHSHMIVNRVNGDLICGVSSDPVRSGCLPSVDPMLSSLSKACNGAALAVILSGMGRDGVEGASELVETGGMVFAQDAKTSAVWGMPGAVAKAGIASFIAAPEQLAEALIAQMNACRVS